MMMLFFCNLIRACIKYFHMQNNQPRAPSILQYSQLHKNLLKKSLMLLTTPSDSPPLPQQQPLHSMISKLVNGEILHLHEQSQLESEEEMPQMGRQLHFYGTYQEWIGTLETGLMVFVNNLEKVAEKWITMLTHDGISSETETIAINNSVTITQIYQEFLSNCQAQIIDPHITSKNAQQFEGLYINETCLALIAEILNNYAEGIVKCFQQGRQEIKTQINRINESIKKTQIMNTYLVFGMLKQMASFTHAKICAKIGKKFPQLSETKIQQFSEYIEKNYQFVELQCLQSGDNYIFSREEMRENLDYNNLVWLAFIKNYKENGASLKRIQNTDGQSGILIEKGLLNLIEQGDDNKQDNKNKKQSKNTHKQGEQKPEQKQILIVKVQKGNKIKVINARVCQKSWQIFQTKDPMSQIYQNLRKQIELSDNSKQYVSYGVPTCQFATIGGSLGKCLADINKYQNANQFFVDLSKTAAICSTISYAMAQIPILSYFIIAGGFSYSFYIACRNEATSTFKKFNQISSATMSAVGSVGSTLGGIMLGQVIIPVPFVGAFIGGVLGGFLGTKGVRDINQFLARSNFNQIISYIRHKIIAERYWQCTKHMLQRIGLSQAYFNSHTPQDQKSRDVYMTAICFCVVTFHQSKRYVEFNKRKMKECQDEEKKKIKGKQYHGLAGEKHGQDEVFESQFNIVKIVDFLTENKFLIIDNLSLLSNFISHFVG